VKSIASTIKKDKKRKTMHPLTLMYALILPGVSADFVPPFGNDNVQQIKCNRGIQRHLLENTTAVYFCKDNMHMIFHSTSLNTLGPNRHNPFASNEDENDMSKKWLEVETNKFSVQSDGGIPFTSCLSLENGGNGAISATFGDTLGTAASLDLDFALVNAGLASLHWGLVGSVGGTFATSAEYACGGKAGQTVQLTVVPAYYRFREAKFRYLQMGNSKTKPVIYNDWEYIPETQVLASSPMMKCVTSPELLRCDSSVVMPRNTK